MADGRWLVAQITTAGDLSGTLNAQIFPLGVGADQIQQSWDFAGGEEVIIPCDGELDECGVCNGPGIAEGTCDCAGTLPACPRLRRQSASLTPMATAFVTTWTDAFLTHCLDRGALQVDRGGIQRRRLGHHLPFLRERGGRFRQNLSGVRQRPMPLVITPRRHLQRRIQHLLECLWHQLGALRLLPRLGIRQLRHHWPWMGQLLVLPVRRTLPWFKIQNWRLQLAATSKLVEQSST